MTSVGLKKGRGKKEGGGENYLWGEDTEREIGTLKEVKIERS